MPRLMALDVGGARIGVAISDASGFLASPYTTIYVSRNEAHTWAEIQRVIEETEADELVIGLPISLDGDIHAQGGRILAFAEKLKAHITLPVTYWDERYSTVEAERLLAKQQEELGGRRQGRGGTGSARKSGKRRKRRAAQEIDALAAAVILQEYLDARRSSHKAEDSQI